MKITYHNLPSTIMKYNYIHKMKLNILHFLKEY